MDTEPLPQHVPLDVGADPGEQASEYVSEIENMASVAPARPHSSADSGPCLYLGPAGQRCERRAADGAFCAVHRPGGIASKMRDPRRILAAAVTIMVLLWPYLDELVHEIIGWKHSH